MHARFTLERPGFSLDVDLRLPGQGVSALFGPSGSGKTTLLRCIAGLERAGRGRLEVDGEVWQDEGLWRPPHRRPIGYVFQEASLFPHLSVLDNLRYGQRRAGPGPAEDLEPVVELLGIGPLLARRPEHLSGGERQRVAIARALAVRPRLLLMDEPLAALDPSRKGEILPYLERVQQSLALPVLYVSHAPDEVARLADHLVVMDAGRVLGHGPLAEVLTRLDLPLRLGDDTGAVLSGQVAEVDPHWQLARVDVGGGQLWVRDPAVPVGRTVRVRVLARDVSLALDPGRSSIQNVLRGEVDAVADDTHPGLALVRVRVGSALLLARLTRRAIDQMAVAPGQALWVQVKSVALLE